MNLGAFDLVKVVTLQGHLDMAAVHGAISNQGLMPNRQVTYSLQGELMEVQFSSVLWGKEVMSESVTHVGHDWTCLFTHFSESFAECVFFLGISRLDSRTWWN